MSAQSALSTLINKYSLSKTLRFELIPIGKTKESIDRKGLLSQDVKRAQSYKEVKKIIDEYHKEFIEKSLINAKLKGLEEFSKLYYKLQKEDKDKKNIKKMQDNLREQISDLFKNNKKDKWNILFKEDLIKKELPLFAKDDKQKNLINEFNKFTTYFTGFHKNRKNMYAEEEKSTSIPYRIIHQNLPKFLDNIRIFEKIKKNKINTDVIEKELSLFLNGIKINDIFSINFFNDVLNQKGITFYNTILGGVSEKDRTKIKGINEYVNTEYNQKQLDKKSKIPKLKQLYKQILSDTETASFVLEQFENDNQLLEKIEQFYNTELINYETEGKTQSVFLQFEQLFKNMQNYDASKIYISNLSIANISKIIFGDWSIICNALAEWYDKHNTKGKKINEYKKENFLKQDFSIQQIEDAVLEYKNDTLNKEINFLLNYFASFLNEKSKKNIIQRIETEYSKVKDLLNTDYPEKKKLASDKDNVSKIKAFLDSLMDFLHFVKPFNIKKDTGLEKEENFYSIYVPLFEQIDKIIPLYNKVRNYLTKKPYSTEKIKLNFENSTLLDGWDLNKESDNTSVVLRKDDLYYLGIMDKKHNRIFKELPSQNGNESSYEKMIYKLLPGPNKMLPKVFFSKKGKKQFKPSKKLLKKYEDGTHLKGDNFNINDCHNLIDFFKESIAEHEDWKQFDFKFSSTSSYKDLSNFYKEVEKQGYKITFQNISENYINQLIDEGKLYLFQIYNKDFSKYSKGTPNLHTLYWKMLFDNDNLKNIVYKLNGKAEVFYRKSSLILGDNIVHKAGEAIINKNPDNEKKHSTFDYDLIKDKRFTLDKFQFHVPITLNFKSEGRQNLNEDVRKFLKNNPDINIIGIDRGERHLLYLTLINQKGKILFQKSLNEITNEYNNKNGKSQIKSTNYHSLLDKKEKKRDEARKNWGIIENIKELKEGYMSQIVHYISKLMIEKNAILSLEDLNFGFKRGRQKVEKQVYQKFEKMMIDKLNYLVFKDKKANETGGLLNALQLTNKFESFAKLYNQSGFIFYVPAWNTSKIDPITGFVNLLKPYYENLNKSQEFFKKFNNIKYNPKQEYFEFNFDYKNFTNKAEGSKNVWEICTTNNERFMWDKTLNSGKGAQKAVDVTQELKKLFDSSKINYLNGNDIKEDIINQNSADFFRKLMKLLSVVLSLRHNNGLKGKDEKDFILSPVEPFFNSLNAKMEEPKDADANGAYNIALKGLLILKQINESEDLRKIKFNLSNKEWLKFAQSKSF